MALLAVVDNQSKSNMMVFQKQDLMEGHYKWSEENKHLFTGEPSRRMFDRFNGNQVLFLINYYGLVSESLTLAECKIIEQRIQHELPQTPISEITVYNWIRNAFFSVK